MNNRLTDVKVILWAFPRSPAPMISAHRGRAIRYNISPLLQRTSAYAPRAFLASFGDPSARGATSVSAPIANAGWV
jgi:hypothetical protein